MLQACFSLIVLDGDLDVPQDLFAGIADNRTKGGNGITGIEIEYAQEVLVLKIVLRIQTATGHERVGGTYRSCVFERDAYVVIIILFEERIGKDAENVMAVVVPILVYKLKSNLLQLIGKTLLAGNIIALLQGCGYCVLMLITIFPKERAARVLSAARVRNIKNVFEPWIVAAGVDQRNALGAATNIAPHLLIPKVIVSTSSSIRFLSKNHQLLMEGILVEPTGSFKKCGPFPKTAGYLLGCMIGHL